MDKLRVGRIHVPRYENVIGLPNRAITTTNSERQSMGCLNKYRFAHLEFLRTTGKSYSLAFGSVWHALLERHHEYYINGGTDAFHQNVDLMGVIHSDTISLFQSEGIGQELSEFTLFEFVDKMYHLYMAWYEVQGARLLQRFEPVATEIALAVPVLDIDGRIFKPVTYITEDEDRRFYRLAQKGDTRVKKVRWPYYNLFTLDGLYRERSSGWLYIFEAKTAASPKQRVSSATIDPQLNSYIYSVNQAIQMGLVPNTKAADECVGFVFDAVCNADQIPPKINKNGTMSKSVKPTSYAMKRWIEENGKDQEEYFDAIIDCQLEGDTRFFQQVIGHVPIDQQERVGHELAGICHKMAEMRLKHFQCKSESEINKLFFRTPICQRGNFCQFKSICLEDGGISRVYNFEVGNRVRWDNLNHNQEESVRW